MPGPLLEKEAECACVLASRGVEIAVIAQSLNVDEEAVAQAVSPRRCAELTNILPDTRVELVWSAGLAGRHLGLAPEPDQHPLRGGDALALRQVYHGARVIGKGAFGQCTSATFSPSGARVVVKTVRNRNDAAGRSYRANFVTVDNVFGTLLAMSAPSAAHANCVRYVDFLVGPEYTCVVMEPLEGPELFEWLNARAAAPRARPGEADGRARRPGMPDGGTLRELAAQMLAAVAFTHERGLIHRDVKIEAFRFRGAAAFASPLVLFDFGLCCPIERKRANAPREICGTLEYIAPEMGSACARAGSYDEKVDVWSAGVCVFALLTASLPFERENRGGYLARLLGLERALFLELADLVVTRADMALALDRPALRDAPPAAVALMTRLLEFEPAKRPSAAEAHALALDDAPGWRRPADLTASGAAPAVDLPEGAYARVLRESKLSTFQSKRAEPWQSSSHRDSGSRLSFWESGRAEPRDDGDGSDGSVGSSFLSCTSACVSGDSG